MSMQRLKFVVRWTDADGKSHRKEYDVEKDARKAKDWLIDNGATSVDIAISMGNREIATKPDEGNKPEPAAAQQEFWYNK